MTAAFAFVSQGFRQMTAYRIESLLNLVGNFATMGMYMAIWAAVLHHDPAARRLMLEYAFINQILAQLNFLPTWELADRFRQGDVALELVKPVPMPLRYLSDFFGRILYRLMLAMPAYGLVAAFLGILHWPGWATFGLFLLSALLGWIIHATIRFTLNAIALWTVQFNQAEGLFHVLSGLFSGHFLPLWYLPPAIAVLAEWMPFAGIFFVPTAIYTGGLTGAAMYKALAIQAGWAAASTGILAVIWRAGTRKLSVMGG